VKEFDEKIAMRDTPTPQSSPEKKIMLHSIINIRDFEKAAAQRLAPEVFACALSFIPLKPHITNL
jgi:hypothetical protein